MNKQLPATATIDSANELSGRVQSYFETLETERQDLRRELELLRTQQRDAERSLGIAESRAERAEAERDQSRAQRDDALAKLISMTTLWGAIKAAVGQGEELVTQTSGALKQSLRGTPSRTTTNHGDAGAAKLDPIGSARVGRLADALRSSDPHADA